MNSITLVLFLLGFVLLIAGAELLVRGASRLAMAAGISPLVVGLTVVAYGTSSPELAVTIQSTYAGQADLAIGNVVGSNIANVLLVLGVTASVSPLVIDQKLVRKEIPLMIGIFFLLLALGLDRKIGLIDGLIFTAGAIAYTVFVIGQSRKEIKVIHEEYELEFDGDKAKITGPLVLLTQIIFIIVGLGLLVVGSRWLTDGAIVLARLFGVSELVIGLTVIAIGTSLPEIATSVVACLRNEQDIVVGNIVGSNIFNILFVLGLGSIVSPNGIDVSATALAFDIPVMIAIAIACLPIFFSDNRIARWEGALFLGYYVAYTMYLYLQATRHSALIPFSNVMLLFVVPITIVTLVVVYFRELKANQRQTKIAEKAERTSLAQPQAPLPYRNSPPALDAELEKIAASPHSKETE